MLASFNRLRVCRHMQRSTLRLLSQDPSLNQDVSASSKQGFANEKLKEKINVEFKNAQKRVLTIPNLLTFSRMATAPFIGYFIWTGAHQSALACFAYAAATDLLDGYIARRYNQASDLGAIIDPIADKLLMITAVIAMYNTSMVPLWLVKAYVVKDVGLLTGGTILRYFGFKEKPSLKKFFDFKNHPTIGFEPTLLSKCNTALQCSLIITQLSTTSMIGIPLYDYGLFGFQLLTVVTTASTMTQYIFRFQTESFFVKVARSRG